MKRLLLACALTLPLAALLTVSLRADVKTRDKTLVRFEGALGTMTRMFGGKAMSEGVVSTNAVQGNRKLTMNDSAGRIVDLGEEKIYDLDVRKKEYRVTTFAEVRQQLKDAQERAAKEAARQERSEQPEQPEQSGKPDKEVEFDFDVKETGQKKSLAGYDTRQVVSTLTIREKGRTLEESGGMVVTVDAWLGPDIPALKELAEFEMKYWKAVAPEASGVSAEQMAAAVALYPLLKPAIERLGQEQAKLTGTPLQSVTTFEGVKSKEEAAKPPADNSGGGIGGMLTRRVMKNKEQSGPRATIMSLTNETLEVATTVAPADLAVPAGFKLKN